MPSSLDAAVEAIIASGQRLDARGLAPATSGNYSVRLSQDRIAVTVSGRHKGRLGPGAIVFLSDHTGETEAATAAGLQTVLLMREQNAAAAGKLARGFDDIALYS
jgi:ribulose-5-phosphate 4-epimerase/fuculose-1-phosphate aldolase